MIENFDHPWGTLDVERRDKRLRIVVRETGDVLYTVPDFMRHKVPGRPALQAVADEIMAGRRTIDAITAFETAYSPRRQKRWGSDAAMATF